MIEYEKHFLFFNILFWTTAVGSSLPRASLICAFSAGFFPSDGLAAGTTHQMLSKWGDCALQCSAFYQQSSDDYKRTDEGIHFIDDTFHLFSLLVAAAFLTLRRDNEMNYTIHTPGTVLKSTCGRNSRPRGIMWVVYVFRVRASKKIRTPFNRATKMPVIGGVSERERTALENLLGTGAPTMVCMHWLCEFLTRRHLEGAFGNVPAPVVSRLTQELSDGMLGFNYARKIAYLPFPFPHAQVAELFLLLLLFLIPLLMVTFVKNAVLGPLFSFFACLSFCSLYEATRDLEDPFMFEPNDLPLPVWMTHFNESLLALKSCARTPSPHLESAKVEFPSEEVRTVATDARLTVMTSL
eukprot:GEMP01044713.1.p1 GENE.GEMP01044713.1~~GEMP01044713.1.p1  ORF type:complete len:353 (+),score=93.53 GEMP01044713.1:229-1287(+)